MTEKPHRKLTLWQKSDLLNNRRIDKTPNLIFNPSLL